jgi:hypothetical protein
MAWPKTHSNFEALKRNRESKIGQKFGTLTITSIGEMYKKIYTFNCICDCGKEKLNVRYGDLKICVTGCLFCKEKKAKGDFYSDENVRKKIMESIEIASNGCWEWQKKLNPYGYAQTKYKGLTQPAHRISYRVFKGEIEKNVCICHTCDNRKCVNPDHLWIGTHKQNAQDRAEKNRSNHYKKKMSINEVLEIRKLYPDVSIKDLSVKFERSDRCIRDIVNWKTWI